MYENFPSLFVVTPTPVFLIFKLTPAIGVLSFLSKTIPEILRWFWASELTIANRTNDKAIIFFKLNW